MRSQGMGGSNHNSQMNMTPGGQMGMGNTRGYGMNDSGHMGPRGGPMYGPGNRMNQMNSMHQINQMNQMNAMNQMNQMNQINQMNPVNQMSQINSMNQMNQMNQLNPMSQMNQMGHPGMNQHPQHFHGGGYGLTSPSHGSPGMNPSQQGIIGSPRIRGSPKMGASPFSPGGMNLLLCMELNKEPAFFLVIHLPMLIALLCIFGRYALSYGACWNGRQ